MKKMIITILLGTTLFHLTACAASDAGVTTTDMTTIDVGSDTYVNVSLANPITECESLEEAEELAGFSITAPDTLDGYSHVWYNVYQLGDTNMIEITWYNESDGEETGFVTIRKEPAASDQATDISGVYISYSEQTTVGDETAVTLSGDDGLVSLAGWNMDGSDYSFYTSQGMDAEDVMQLISTIQ